MVYLEVTESYPISIFLVKEDTFAYTGVERVSPICDTFNFYDEGSGVKQYKIMPSCLTWWGEE